ncbi:MAG: hypothetical protein ACC612_10870 [Methanomethylovorans sp.]|uniref:hypothetical protein n=1 Tax=Methanomethylovorans sp. TaxID=2758717 RepID=UPI00353169D4
MNVKLLSKYWKNHELTYILFMLLSTRIMLSVIGVMSRKVFMLLGVTWYESIGISQSYWTGNIWLDIWGVWDAGWYMTISQNGYTAGPFEQLILEQTNIAFFPLYPLLMRFFGYILGNHYIAGLIISNICLFISCIYLYKLVKLDFDKYTASKSVKYLLFFPTSFILSGVFSESLYLALTVICFYYARTGKWQTVGIIGFFLALTRSTGVLVVLPLLYEGIVPLLNENKNLRSIKFSRKEISPLFYLLLIPLGLIFFMIFNYYLTGDFMAFAHAQLAWDRHLTNPLYVLITGYKSSVYTAFEAIFTLLFSFIILLSYRKIRFSYWLFCMYSIFIPLSTGIMSMPRFISVIFPIYILFAGITKNRLLEDLITMSFVLLQGSLMVFWANNICLVV